MTWRISNRAVDDYLRILGRPRSVATRYQAQAELREIAERALDSNAQARELADGRTQYRGPKPLRLRLITDESGTLVEVKPDHEARGSHYDRSAGGRGSKQRRDAARRAERQATTETAFGGAIAALAAQRAELIRELDRLEELVRAAARAYARGARGEASRILTEAADLEHELTGETEVSGVLFETLCLSDGAAERLEKGPGG